LEKEVAKNDSDEWRRGDEGSDDGGGNILMRREERKYAEG
jgi:hypothetical protein